MLSSLLPKPKHATHETIRVILPTTSGHSNALLPVSITSSEQASSLRPEEQLSVLKSSDNTEDYSKLVAQITGNTAAVQTSYEDTIPLKVRYPNLKHHFPRYTLANCPDNSLSDCLLETREVINMLLARAAGVEEKTEEVTVVEIPTDGLQGEDRGRTVEIRNYQEDPMLPPKFKLRKNRHKNPSPPPPILKAAPAKQITKETKDYWKIPSAVSNWKNNQGFAISLGKRVLAASGGSVDTGASINVEKFGELSLALEMADKLAREEISIRNEQRKAAALKQQSEKQQQLQALVGRTRTEHRGPKRRSSESYNASKRSRN